MTENDLYRKQDTAAGLGGAARILFLCLCVFPLPIVAFLFFAEIGVGSYCDDDGAPTVASLIVLPPVSLALSLVRLVFRLLLPQFADRLLLLYALGALVALPIAYIWAVGDSACEKCLHPELFPEYVASHCGG